MKRSSGILMYRFLGCQPMVLLVHPGGPFWRNRDLNSWSIPKGEFSADETAQAAAIRSSKRKRAFVRKASLSSLATQFSREGKELQPLPW